MEPGIRILDWLVETGVRVAPEEEILGDPVCRVLDDKAFHEGIVGPLTPEQRAQYCMTEEPFEPAVEERARKFQAAREACPLEDGGNVLDALEAHITCLCKNLEKEGLNVC